jgi:hypothetical protein
MAKNFKGGLDSILGEATGKKLVKRGRPQTNLKIVTKTSQVGTKMNETRATFIINEEQLENIKALAHWERLSIKEVMFQAIDAHLATKKRELPKAIESYKGKSE